MRKRFENCFIELAEDCAIIKNYGGRLLAVVPEQKDIKRAHLIIAESMASSFDELAEWEEQPKGFNCLVYCSKTAKCKYHDKENPKCLITKQLKREGWI